MPKPNEQAGSLEASVQPEEIPGIVQGLRDAFNKNKTRSREWRLGQLQALERMITEGREELCAAMHKDLHKSHFEGYMQEMALVRAEIFDAIQHLDEWMADEPVGSGLLNAPAVSVVQKDPLGVVLVLGAWNYNVLLSLQPTIGAIAAGNCVLMKPGSYSENSGHVLVKLVTKYLDNECIRGVEGNRHITNAILEQKLDMIFMTGSPFVGKVVAEAAAKQLCPVVLELGGKSPCIIDKTADLYVAAHRAGWGALMNCGQTCVRPDYFMVHEDVADQFIQQLRDTIHEFYGGDAKNSEWFGRLVNDAAYKRLMRCVEDARDRIVIGGDHDESQRFIEPTVFDFGTDFEAFMNSQLMADENFGPLIPIFRYRDLDNQVLAFIRAQDKPLALYCFTTDDDVAERTLRLTSSGGAIINDVVVHLSNPELPFGGVGASGMGSYHGKRTFDAFTHEKAVLRRFNILDAPQRYPPYTNLDQMVMNVALHPKVSFYYGRVGHMLSDKKNIALALMSAYIARGWIMKPKL